MTNVGMPDRLTRCLESLLAMNDLEFVMIFVLICRALGYNTRLVVNFNTVPMKPSNEPIQIDAQGKDNQSSNTSNNDSKEGKSRGDQDKKKNVTSTSTSRGCNSSNVGKGDKNTHKRQENDTKVKRKSKSTSKVSDSEGDSDAGYGSSKKKKNKKSDIIAAAKSRKSSRVSASTLKNLEEEIIKSIDEKYPTNQNEKSKSRKELKSNKESKTKNSKNSDKSKAVKESKSSVSKKVSKSTNASKGQNYWVEVYVTKDKKWIPVDPITGKLNSVSELESKASKPMLYVLAVNNKGKVKDVTQWIPSQEN